MIGPCLVRRDVLNVARCNEKTNPTIIYLNKKKITVGRAHYVDYRILSKRVTDIHVTIKTGNNPYEWLFRSTASFKGTFVNNYKVKDGVDYLMKDGDVLRFGIEISEPINVFVCRLNTRERDQKLGWQKGTDILESCYETQQKIVLENQILKNDLKAALRGKDNLDTELQRRNILVSELKEKYEALKTQMKRLNYETKDKQKQLIAYYKVSQETREHLRSTMEEKTRLNERLIQVLQAKQQRDRVAVIEKKKVESALQYSSCASNVLHELVEVSECSSSFETTNDLASLVTIVLKAELQCGVCTELLIEAMTLECSHTFCSYCIAKWSKSRNDCPTCSRPFAMFTKTLALDGFIDKVLDLLSPKLKDMRLKMISIRKSERGADTASYFSRNRTCPLTSETLWSRLASYLKELLHGSVQEPQPVSKKKLEWALHYSFLASRVLQELVNTTVLNDLEVALTTLLETELQCGICTEVVIEALTLQCSHMFCSYCIKEWSKLKDECPICRQPVMMFTKTLALNGFIDKVLDFLSPTLKTMRLEITAERRLAEMRAAPSYR